MVLRKRLYYGFNGYQAPVVPRAPRSARRRFSKMKPVEDHQICPFELLADIAGKLLQETESSAASNASQAKDVLGTHLDETRQEQVEDHYKASRSGCFDQGSCVESVFIPDLEAKELKLQPALEDVVMSGNDSLVHASNFTSSDDSKKIDCELKLGTCSTRTVEDNLFSNLGSSYPLQDIWNGRVKNGTKQLEDEILKSKDITDGKICSVKKAVDKCMKSEALINSDSSVQLPLYRGSLHSGAFLKHRNNLNLGIRDDDENSFRCNKLRTKIRAFRPQQCNSYRRIRKMLTSKYWKMTPKLKDYDVSNTNEASRLSYRSRKTIHFRDRYRCEAPSKRRKLSSRSFVIAYDHETSSESISNSPEKRINSIKGKRCSSDMNSLRGNGMTSFVKDHRKSKDSKVKLSIKSFKVPELYIELPETATVASLKMTVMETVMEILGGGLHVGVVLQGKKVRDDNKTLQQAGIIDGGNLDSLGFTLEPNFSPLPASPKESPHSFQCEFEHQLLTLPSSPVLDSGVSSATFGSPLTTARIVDQLDSNKEIMSSVAPTDVLNNDSMLDVTALVARTEVNAEPLQVLPLNQKSKRCETSQRRTRRPFSVTEVESLVEAVEIFGTGRWRDVKMRAFENADHRTYVDLKDKWKTLVHTASIAPQQRRGQPVPQELLDRVLCAHSYWTEQHLSKQHGKQHHAEPLKIMDAQGIALEVCSL